FGTEPHKFGTASSMRGASVADRFSSRLERKLYHPEPNDSRRMLRCLRYRIRGCLMMNAKHFGEVVQGHWTKEAQQWSINTKELIAAERTIKAYLKWARLKECAI